VEAIVSNRLAAAHGAKGPNWKDVWRVKWIQAEDDTVRSALAEEATTWLKTDLTQTGWTYVWKELWEHLDGQLQTRAELAGLALAWLQTVDPRHARWSFVWLTLWDHAKIFSPDELPLLAARGLDWLADDRQRIEWDLVWHALWSIPHLKNEATRDLAIKRMQLNPLSDPAPIEQQILAFPAEHVATVIDNQPPPST
jgi:hypothetical protein